MFVVFQISFVLHILVYRIAYVVLRMSVVEIGFVLHNLFVTRDLWPVTRVARLV